MATCCFILWIKWISSWAVRYLIACLVYFGLEIILSRYIDMEDINSTLGAFFQPGKYVVSIVVPKAVSRMLATSLGYEEFRDVPDEALAAFEKLFGLALPMESPTMGLVKFMRLVL